ncbi:MAG: glycine dehydrogenase, partial [Sulfolobales archaeon]
MAASWLSIARGFLEVSAGIEDILDLFSDVPKELMVNKELNVGLGKPLSEVEVRRYFKSLTSKNRVFSDPPPFTGGGVCAHYVPSVVKSIIGRGEFYTAYTPYQPEISQGILQALFEYQSLIAELYGVDV